MGNLSDKDRERLIKILSEGKDISPAMQKRLFETEDVDYVEATKDYKLVYKGKTPESKVIAETPAAPLQETREFNTKNKFDDGWSNKLIFGDNLYALKAIYEDQRGENKLGTKNKIKLIYIDPPFATKSDFMKDREKAYRDKVIGSEFIEFLRKRLILMREILANDGSIFVHLDWKKGHYIKAVLDEVFGEYNFRSEIAFKGTPGHHLASGLDNMVNNIFYYSKGASAIFRQPYQGLSGADLKKKFPYYEEETGRWFTHEKLEQTSNAYSKNEIRIINGKEVEGTIGWRWSQNEFDKRFEENPHVIFWTQTGRPRYKRYLDQYEGRKIGNIWDDLDLIGSNSKEFVGYPTQKPESLLERIISMSTVGENDIVLDGFIGSGTTIAVAEKLGRKWIGIDCGKLSVYTAQRRLLNLTRQIGSQKKDERQEHERVEDFVEHEKASRGLLMITEKARAGDLVINDAFLTSLGEFIGTHLAGRGEEYLSLVCPEKKFQVTELEVLDIEDEKAGEKLVRAGRVKFLISFIKPKEKVEKPKSLKARHFKLYSAGMYDNKMILDMNWEQYKPFVAQLFDVRLSAHKIKGFEADGYIGTNSCTIWNYPENKGVTLDEVFVDSLHETLGGRGGDKFYVIAPIVAVDFMQDEIVKDKTKYVFLKVPLSILMNLIEKKEAGALKQPVTEDDVNEVIDAVGYDFISQPVIKAKYRKTTKEYIITIDEFRSNTLVYDPDEFENFETLSMVMVDVDYNLKTKVFDLDHVYWSDKIVNSDKSKAEIRIPADEFTGKAMMIIIMDKYGNEYKVVKKKGEF